MFLAGFNQSSSTSGSAKLTDENCELAKEKFGLFENLDLILGNNSGSLVGVWLGKRLLSSNLKSKDSPGGLVSTGHWLLISKDLKWIWNLHGQFIVYSANPRCAKMGCFLEWLFFFASRDDDFNPQPFKHFTLKTNFTLFHANWGLKNWQPWKYTSKCDIHKCLRYNEKTISG